MSLSAPFSAPKPKVLVLYTGGTIGMRRSPEGYRPVAGFESLLREKLAGSAHDPLPDFVLQEFDHLIDSANIQPSDWKAIATEIIARYDDYDGFVVLHGTDTMAYTASALSFQLQQLDKPVILTGSQIPLIEVRNDALDNLITALIIAGFHDVPEVCLYFNGRLLRGNRARKVKATGLDAFDSPNYPWLGQVGIHVELQRMLIRPGGSPVLNAADYEPSAVAMLPIYPGLCPRHIEGMLKSETVKGIVMQSYGVGNLPDANRDLMSALTSAIEHGKLIVNLSGCLQAEVMPGAYASSSELDAMGIIPGGKMTPEAAFTKLSTLLAYGLDAQNIHQQMQLNLCGELD